MEVVFNLMQGIIIVAIEVFCCVFFLNPFFIVGKRNTLCG